MDDINKAIWKKFHVKYNDVLPFQGWVGNRETLAELFKELGFKNAAEVGVDKGKYSTILCKHNPELKLKCVDPWKAYGLHTDEQIEECYQNALLKLAQYKDNIEFIRKPSIEAAKDIPNKSLDFVYIDAMHDFDNVIMDIIAWVPKVRVGGIMSGHDYYKTYAYGVIPAVDAYTRVHNINMWYITREEGRRIEGVPSWFWVKS